MSKHRWGRSQKYHVRPRHLYVLLFENGCAYVGQSVDVREREQQHRRPAGGWAGRSFQCVHLATVNDTEERAKEHEHAWRHKAAKSGWTIYAKPPAMVVDHHRQMNLRRYMLAWSLRWPKQHSRNRRRPGWMIALALGALAWLAFL